MAATTTQLGLVTPTQGDLSGTWGNTVNNGITEYTNIAIAGTLTLTNDGAVTLANTTGDASASFITSTLTGAGTVTAQFAIVRVTGTLTVAKVVTGPSYSKTYTVVNAATGGIVTFKASGQTGVSVAVGESAFVYFNGTDYVKLVGTATAGAAGGSTTQVQFNSSGVLAGSANLTFNGTTLTANTLNLTNALGTAYGGTGLTSFTSGGVVYASSTSALAQSANLTFNGTTLTVNDLTDSSLTVGRVTFAGTAGNLIDSANLTFDGTNLGVGLTPTGQSRVHVYTGNNAVNGIQTQFNVSNFPIALASSTSSGFPYLGVNTVQKTSSNTQTYALTGFASRLHASGGGFTFSTAASGTAGADITFTDAMTLDASGNLGVGTTSPSVASGLGIVVNGGAGQARIALKNTNSGDTSGDGFQLAIDTSSNAYIDNRENTALIFNTNNTERMRIANDGKVGIATTSPYATLQIGSGIGGGNAPVTSKLMFGANNSIVTFLSASDAASVDGEIGSWNTVYNHQNAKIVFDKPTGNTGQILFYTQNGTGITERFRIASNGSFGLSGANYGTSGQVLTSGGSGAAPTWTTVGGGSSQWTTSGSDIYYNTGNVGIGTTTPGGKLDVKGATSANNTIYLTNGNAGNYANIIQARDSAGTLNASISFSSLDNSILFNQGASNTERMRINSAGNLGVGTSAPTSLLHTSGALCVGGSGTSGTNGTVTLTKINNGTFDVTMGISGGNDPGLIEITAVQNDYSGASFGFLKAYYFVAQASVQTPATSSTATGTTFTVSFTNLTSSSYRVTVTQSRQQLAVSVTVLGARNIT